VDEEVIEDIEEANSVDDQENDKPNFGSTPGCAPQGETFPDESPNYDDRY